MDSMSNVIASLHEIRDIEAANTMLQFAKRPTFKVSNGSVYALIRFLMNTQENPETKRTVAGIIFQYLHPIPKFEYKAALKRIFQSAGIDVSDSHLCMITHYYVIGIDKVLKHREFADYAKNKTERFRMKIKSHMHGIAKKICIQLARQ